MNHNFRQDEHFKLKNQLEFEGHISRLQPYNDTLVSFYIDEMDSIYIYDPQNQQILRIIPVFEKISDDIQTYIIKEDHNHLILVQAIDNFWKSKFYKLDEDVMFEQPQSQIIGVRDQIIIFFQLLDFSKTLQIIRLKIINLQGEILYKRFLITTRCLWHFCFDTSFIIILFQASRYWVFLKNYRRIQLDFNQRLYHPVQNFTHNKNYYVFGQKIRRCVNFVVRINTRFKIIRKIFFNYPSAIARQIEQWLYITDFDCQTKQSPFIRVNLTNCSVQLLIDDEGIALMTRTNCSKYLVYSDDKVLKTIEIINE